MALDVSCMQLSSMLVMCRVTRCRSFFRMSGQPSNVTYSISIKKNISNLTLDGVHISVRAHTFMYVCVCLLRVCRDVCVS